MKLLALLSCFLFTGCASFRAAVRDLNNTDLVGDPAPALEAGDWVGDEELLEGDWYLVAFLLPT